MAPLRSAPLRSAPLRLAKLRLAWMRLAKLRSGRTSLCCALHTFQAELPCLSRSRCSWFAISFPPLVSHHYSCQGGDQQELYSAVGRSKRLRLMVLLHSVIVRSSLVKWL